MKNKFDEISSFLNVALPFVIAAIGFVNSIHEKDPSHFREACMWAVIGCAVGRLEKLEKKNGSIH